MFSYVAQCSAVRAFNLDLLLSTFMLIGACTCNELLRFGIVIRANYSKSSENVKIIKSEDKVYGSTLVVP